MGPFVPDIITDELNLVFGFLIGVAFGFVLEQAGFSSSRKLTGLFYGRDFTVLRVFFTAAITAMSGILLLAYFGLLDREVIYINPTYIWAAIIGGIIMGVGFVVGGYCPGTSVCGAAIGKIDAMAFIGGGVIGVFLFGESYPLLNSLYNGDYLGELTVPAALGLSPGLFALAVIVVAIGAFIVTTKIEQRVSEHPVSKSFPVSYHRIASVGVVLLGAILLFLPDRKSNLLGKITDENFILSQGLNSITSDELAFRILDHDPKLQIIDVRDSASSAATTLPGALNIPLEEMFGKQWSDILDSKKMKVIIAGEELSERRAAALALALGYKNIRFLEGGLKEFYNSILTASTSNDALHQDQQDTYRFRLKAAGQIAEMIKQQAAGPKRVARPVKKVAGGCGA